MSSLSVYMVQSQENPESSMILVHSKFQEILKATFEKIKTVFSMHWKVHGPIMVYMIQHHSKTLCPQQVV